MEDKSRDIVNEYGDVLPSYEDEDNRPKSLGHDDHDYEEDRLDFLSDLSNIMSEQEEKDISNATSRVVGEMAIEKTIGKPEGMSDGEWFEILKEERAADRSGTVPGTSREPSPEEIAAAKKAKKERQKALKLKKRIDEAKRLIRMINPATAALDSSLAKELRDAKDFLIKNGLNPDNHVPNDWKY